MVDTNERPLQFGGYALLERLGSGGMGEVFKAVTLGPSWLQRQVAIKCMRPELTSSPALVEMFMAEARLCSLLNHPNIVRVHDFGQVDGRYFLTMEYLDGKNLRGLLAELDAQKQAPPLEVACFVAAEIANALAYAHTWTLPDGTAMDLVHHDVTPSNIMLLRSGGVKLLDFGVATVSGGGAVRDREQPGNHKGKLPYLAPERLAGQGDRRSDIFSLGVVLWESLIGRSLFRGDTMEETLNNLQHRAVPPPSHFRPELPPVLDRVTLRALDRDPDRRYQDAISLARDLEEFLDDERFHSKSIAGGFHDLVFQGSPAQGTPPPMPLLELASSGQAPPAPPALVPRPSQALCIQTPRRPRRKRVALYGLVVTAALLAGAWQVRWSPSEQSLVSRAEARRPFIVPLPGTPEAPSDSAPPADSASGVARRSRKPVRARRAEQTTLDPFARREAPTARPEGLW